MYHTDILGAEYLVHRMFLYLVQVRETHGAECEPLGFHGWKVEQVAQIRQPVAFRSDHPIERIEHRLVTSFIERQLNTDGIRTVQHITDRC